MMRKIALALLAVSLSMFLSAGMAQERINDVPAEQLKKGTNLYPYKDYSAEDHTDLVKKYDGLRVTDVLDAMQAVGLQDIGFMDHSIRPLWRDHTDKLTHRIYGVAVTYRYLPTNRPQPGKMPYEDFRKWHSKWYGEQAPEVFKKIITPGTVVVIDAQGIENTGFIGSNNALGWKSLGMHGVITNGCCRDTDEIIIEKIPVYSKCQGGGTRPGRIETGTINQPVTVGGVLIRAGDIVVADGDGVIVVPRENAEKVAEIAWDIATGDKRGRKKLYEKMKMPIDETVQ
jgi:regulator of RNase E activity RraA